MPRFNKILDTFLFKDSDIHLKNFHIDRVYETYVFLNAAVTREQVAAVFESIVKQLQSESGQKLVRVLFDPSRVHKHTVEIKEPEPVKVPVSLVLTEASGVITPESCYKFAERPHWEALLNSRPQGSDDVLIVRDGLLVETSRFNIFLHDSEKNLVITPLLESGCLNGVFRRAVLHEGSLEVPDAGKVKISEGDVSVESLGKNKLYVGNSVRGLLPTEIL